MTDSAETMRALVRWLKNAPTSVYTFTTDGQATVCHPRYLLASDRDVIIALLEREIAALSASGTKSDGEVKEPSASIPDYNGWSLYRHHFPDRFARTAAYSREIGARLARIDNERIYIDEIPTDWPMTQPIVPACDFLCALAEDDVGHRALAEAEGK